MTEWYVKIGIKDPLTNRHVAITIKHAHVRERTPESVTDAERRELSNICDEVFDKLTAMAVKPLPLVMMK